MFLDNPGISRTHARIQRENGILSLRDLESANGTFLNDGLEPVRVSPLEHGDRVRVGKYSLEVSLVEERRGTEGRAERSGPTAYEGTMVLDAKQIDRLMAQARMAEQTVESNGSPGSGPGDPQWDPVVVGNVVAEPSRRPSPIESPASRPGTGPAWPAQLPGLITGFAVGAAVGAVVCWMILG